MCTQHDFECHKFNGCHDRQLFVNGYYEDIPSNMIVIMQEDGQHIMSQTGNLSVHCHYLSNTTFEHGGP